MLILEPCAGLSNRILAIATAYRMAKEIGQDLEVLWDIDGAVGVDVKELFCLPADIKVRVMTKLPYHKRPYLRARSEIVRMLLRRRADVFWDCGDTERMHKEYGRDEIKRQLSGLNIIYIKSFCELTKITDNSIFKIFEPSGQILQKGKEIFEAIGAKTVGFHIRRTDHEEAIRKSPLELFYQKAQELLTDGRAEQIFLATDDKEVECNLAKRFPGEIICYQGKQFARNDKEGMQDGLIDMLALSKCSMIYGSYGSTFSRMASYLGNKELIVVQKQV